jgi:ABC-type multidrug transport system fused ATPase/permease subunit
MVVAVMLILLSSQPMLAIIALAPLPFVNLAARRFSNSIHPAILAVQAEQAELANVVEESVSGVRVVKGFGAEATQMRKLEKEANDIRGVSLGAAKIRSKFLPGIDLVPSIGLIAVLGIGGHRVINGQMSVGDLVAFNTYLTMLIWPLRNIGMTVAFGQRAAAAPTVVTTSTQTSALDNVAPALEAYEDTALRLAQREIELGRHNDARVRLQRLLARIDAVDAARRADVEAQASFLVAQSLQAQADLKRSKAQ